jgi:hypothetical protein
MKKRNVAIITILVILLVLFVIATQINLIDLSSFNFNLTTLLDDGTMRLILIVLVCVGAMQSVGLYLLSKRPQVSPIQVDPQHTEQRGRGRPRKPCQLALVGALPCPLEPSLDLDPDFVARVSDAVAHYQHEKLTGKPESESKLIDIEGPSAEQKSEVLPPAKGQEEKPDTEKDKKKVGEAESVGDLMVDILEKKTQKVKDEKKK